VTRGDAQLLHALPISGCDLIGRTRPIDATTDAIVGSPDYANAPQHTLVSTVARIGAETPSGRLRVRALVGGGALRDGHALPVGVASLGVGTQGPGTRIHVEWEHAVSRVSGRRTLFLYESRTAIPLGRTTESVRGTPQWSTLRMLLEIPLGR